MPEIVTKQFSATYVTTFKNKKLKKRSKINSIFKLETKRQIKISNIILKNCTKKIGCGCSHWFQRETSMSVFVTQLFFHITNICNMEKYWTNLSQLVGKVRKIIMGEKTFFNFFMASDLCAELES